MALNGKFSKDHFSLTSGDFLLAEDDPNALDQTPTIIKTSGRRGKKLEKNDFQGLIYTTVTDTQTGQPRDVRASEEMVAEFADLIHKCLELDPHERILPADA